MDAITLLREDHEKVLAMFDELETALQQSEGDARGLEPHKDLLATLVIAESQHEAVEEQYFWPAVRAHVPDGEALAAHAVAQETEAKEVLDRIDKAVGPLHPELVTLVSSFVKDGREHIAYEQEQVWPKVQQALGAEALEDLGDKMATAKKAAPTRPHQHTPPKPGVLKTAGAGAGLLDKARDALSGRGKHRP
jgi:hemerythrin-like domain-containing protein